MAWSLPKLGISPKSVGLYFSSEEIDFKNIDFNVDEKKLYKEKLTVFGNLPYNISTEILCKWILNLNNDYFWFNCLILMFQKEVADRIISDFNSTKYGRLSIISQWKLDVNKICDIKPNSFYPKPKVDSSLLFFKPKKNYYNFDDPKNLELITRIFFNQRSKELLRLHFV